MNYEEAKKMLSNSSKAGKIIHLGNNEWGVEYLPEREIEYKKHMKQRQDAALERKKKEKEENESNEKRLKNIQKMKKRESEIKYQKQLLLAEDRKKREQEKVKRQIEFAEKTKKREEEELERRQRHDDEIRKKIADKFEGSKTLMQYRCAGSKGKTNEGTEWGVFIFLRDGKYHRQHESPDRVLIANKKKIEVFKDKKDAIEFCNYLLFKTDNYWYTDTKYLKQSDLDLDFPTKKPPNKEELEAAVQSFISYRDMQLYSDEELRQRKGKSKINSNEQSIPDIEEEIQKLLKKAETNINEQKFASAIEKLSLILEKSPSYEKALFLRAFSLSKINDNDGAIIDYKKYLEINSNDQNALYNLGIARLNINNYHGAIEAFSKALNIDPSLSKAFYGRALARDNLKEFEGAILDYEKSLKIDPENQDALINLGIARAYLENNEGALQSFKKVLKVNPTNLEVIYFCGVLKTSMNDISGALEEFAKIVKIDKSFKDAELKFNELSKKLRNDNSQLEEQPRSTKKKQSNFSENDNNKTETNKQKGHNSSKKENDFKDFLDIENLKKEFKKINDSQKIRSIKEKLSRIELFNLKQTGEWISNLNRNSASSENNLDLLLAELDSYIGLKSVKDEINKIVNFQTIQKERQNHGFSKQNLGNHMVFYGPPGTGKTMIARLVGRIFNSLGLLSKGHFIETDRTSFIGQHIGQTGLKTRKVLDSALGGVLFIDEAYSIYSNSSQNDFGPEAISTILKYMEDHRNDLIVIVAGYQEEMFNFLETNPGFKSRFNSFLNFPDYSEKELLEILLKLSTDQGYLIDGQTKKSLKNYLAQISEFRQETFGNARSMRNLLEIAIKNQANRLMEYEERSKNDLSYLTINDFMLDLQQLKEI